MSENINLLRSLLDYVEQYEKDVGNYDIKEFSVYLNDQILSKSQLSNKNSFDSNDYQNYKKYAEVEFSTMLTGLFRYAKHYIKKALVNTSFKTIDEFGFLATLLRENNLLKHELINRHLLEISSGSEIIKRLIKNGLIQEYPDKRDKRAKQVSLTDKGRVEIISAFDDMHKVSEIVIGNLNENELKSALFVFNKLTYFHQHIHKDDKNTDLDELRTKYIPSK